MANTQRPSSSFLAALRSMVRLTLVAAYSYERR
jgi:hypothetical protein